MRNKWGDKTRDTKKGETRHKTKKKLGDKMREKKKWGDET